MSDKLITLANLSEFKAKCDLTYQTIIDSSHKLSYTLLSDTPTIPTKVSDLTNDEGYQTASDVTTAIDLAIAGVYKIAGSQTVAYLNNRTNVPANASSIGKVYNVTDSGTLNNYSGTTSVNAGDNVVFVFESATSWHWDKLAGEFTVTTATNAEVDALFN